MKGHGDVEGKGGTVKERYGFVKMVLQPSLKVQGRPCFPEKLVLHPFQPCGSHALDLSFIKGSGTTRCRAASTLFLGRGVGLVSVGQNPRSRAGVQEACAGLTPVRDGVVHGFGDLHQRS